MNPSQPTLSARQRGAVLIVTLVMLGILTIIVAAMVSTSNINFRIAGNQQYKAEALLTAQNAVEIYISNKANFKLPLPTTAVTIPNDLDGDGVSEYQAVVPPPACLHAIPIKLPELDLANPDDAPCYGSGAVAESGILSDGRMSGNSWCSKMMWDVEARVDDSATTQVRAEVHQGIYLKALVGTTCP